MQYATLVSQKLRKLVRALHQKQHRDLNSLFIAEGEKICRELLESTYEPELLVVRDSVHSDVVDLAKRYVDRGIPIYNAPKHVFDQMSETKSPQGIIAVVNIKEQTINPDLNFIALDGLQDPGNVGTIIRTAEWYGINQILLSADSADQYNPKTVRSTMGSLFRVNVVSVPDLADTLKNSFKDFEIYTGTMNSKTKLNTISVGKKFGLVFGNEGNGISEPVKKVVKKSFTITGVGSTESLNVAVACGISLAHFVTANKK